MRVMSSVCPWGSLLLLGDRTKQVNKQNPVGCRWAVEGALVWLGGHYGLLVPCLFAFMLSLGAS